MAHNWFKQVKTGNLILKDIELKRKILESELTINYVTYHKHHMYGDYILKITSIDNRSYRNINQKLSMCISRYKWNSRNFT